MKNTEETKEITLSIVELAANLTSGTKGLSQYEALDIATKIKSIEVQEINCNSLNEIKATLGYVQEALLCISKDFKLLSK